MRFGSRVRESNPFVHPLTNIIAQTVLPSPLSISQGEVNAAHAAFKRESNQGLAARLVFACLSAFPDAVAVVERKDAAEGETAAEATSSDGDGPGVA